MTEKRFTLSQNGTFHTVKDNVKNKSLGVFKFKDNEFPVYFCFHQIIDLLNSLNDENKRLKKELKRCKDWINSDQNDYELTLAFIKNKGYSLKDVLEYEKKLKE